LVYDSLCKLAAVSGVWRYPAARSGDLEEMTFLDKVYWVYKGSSPIERAEKDSGLERLFAAQREVSELPQGFEPASSIRICADGDLMNHAYLARSSALFDDVEGVLFGADIATANLECVVIEPREILAIDLNAKAGPPLAMSHAAFKTVASRFHFLATACNRSIDFGASGVSSTIAAIRDAGIAFHGVNENEQDAARATLVERSGVRIAFLSHTFGTNAHPKPADRPWIVNHTRLNRRVADIDFDLLQRQLAHCRDQAAEFVIAQLHWGMEFEMYPRRTQVEVARHIAELGVDAIIGHHPHVLQPVEYYRTIRDPDRVVPIFYSLGNLTTPFASEFMCRSGIADLTLSRGRTASGDTRTYATRAQVHEDCRGIGNPVNPVLRFRPDFPDFDQ
jgi:poly-gamma-glutamate synthesis protein (capsule biosynthesis protein)